MGPFLFKFIFPLMTVYSSLTKTDIFLFPVFTNIQKHTHTKHERNLSKQNIKRFPLSKQIDPSNDLPTHDHEKYTLVTPLHPHAKEKENERKGKP